MQRIVIDADICGGQPCIRGTRVLVHVILDFLATGESIEEVIEDYPQISRNDVLACLAFAASLVRGEAGVPTPRST